MLKGDITLILAILIMIIELNSSAMPRFWFIYFKDWNSGDILNIRNCNLENFVKKGEEIWLQILINTYSNINTYQETNRSICLFQVYNIFFPNTSIIHNNIV